MANDTIATILGCYFVIGLVWLAIATHGVPWRISYLRNSSQFLLGIVVLAWPLVVIYALYKRRECSRGKTSLRGDGTCTDEPTRNVK